MSSKMMKCKTCQADIAASAKHCPSCGAKNKKPILKKWWFWAVIIIIIIAVAGGGEDSSSPSQENAIAVDGNSEKSSDVVNNTNTESTVEEDKTEFVIGEVAHLSGVELQVVDAQISEGGEYNKPKDGFVYVIVDILMKNVSDSTQSYNTFDFKMQNSNGQITNSGFTMANNENPLSSGALSPGGIVRGTIAFEQPKGDTGLKLIYQGNMFSNKTLTVDLANKLESFDLLQGEQMAASEDMVKVGEPLVVGDAQITVTAVEKSSGDDWNTPASGNEYIIVSLEIKNLGKDVISYNPFDYAVKNSQGNITDQAFTILNSDTALSSGQLASGGTVSGTIVFEQPKDDPNLVLVYTANAFTGKTGEIKLN